MEAELLPGWFCIPCHTHPAGGHLGTCLQPPQLLQPAPSAGHGSSLVQTGSQGRDTHFQLAVPGESVD